MADFTKMCLFWVKIKLIIVKSMVQAYSAKKREPYGLALSGAKSAFCTKCCHFLAKLKTIIIGDVVVSRIEDFLSHN